MFNRDIAVDWADPDEEPDDTAMSEVKVLYVRNLTSDVAENDVKDLFLPYGNIERVRKVRVSSVTIDQTAEVHISFVACRTMLLYISINVKMRSMPCEP